MKIKLNKVAICTLAFSLSGCATIAGPIVEIPQTEYEVLKWYNTEYNHILRRIPYSIGLSAITAPISFISGVYHGACADLYFCENGKYPSNYNFFNPSEISYTEFED